MRSVVAKSRPVPKKIGEVVRRACRALRAPATETYVAAGAGKLQGLIKDGVTVGEALAVARYASKRYESGDPFLPLLNLTYIWAPRKFPAMAAAMARAAKDERRLEAVQAEMAKVLSKIRQRDGEEMDAELDDEEI